MNDEQKKMTPLPTGQVLPNIWAIDNQFVNFFILRHGDAVIAIDTGADAQASLAALKTLDIAPEQINTVLLTHDHGDHTALLSQFTNAQVYAFGNSIFKHDHIQYTQVTAGETLDIHGLSVQVIHTPGHKTDHVCYLLGNGILFAGDVMSIQNGETALFNEVYNEDNEQQAHDIQQLKKRTDITHILTAHYGLLTI